MDRQKFTFLNSKFPYFQSPFYLRPQGKILKYFNKYDNIKIARQKWLAAIKHDYAWFWDILHQFHPKTKLPPYEIVKFQDLAEIIKFINPKAWNLSIVDPIYSKRIAKIVHNVKHYKHWVVSRHKFYYEWIFFGWKLLPNDYPFHRPVNSTEYPDHISNWVHKRFSHKNYLNQELFYRDDDRDFVPLKLCKIINPNQPESH